MWDDSQQIDEQSAANERAFQKMLLNNMESVTKIFFRGVQIIKIKPSNNSNDRNALKSLNELER